MNEECLDVIMGRNGSPVVATRRNLEKLLFSSLLVVHLLPIWLFAYFPTTDGPAHVDNATALLRYFQPDESTLHEYYILNLRLVPNWLTSLVLAGLVALVSPVTADKLLISFYVLLLPFSIRYSLAAISQDAVYISILVFPLVYNHLLHYGFYNFLFSIPVCIFIIGYWLRDTDRVRPRKIFALASLILLLYFCHIVAFVVLTLTLIILALVRSLHSTSISCGSLSDILQSGRRVFQSEVWIPLIIALAPSCVLAARFILGEGSLPVWPKYSWVFLAWPVYGVTATSNMPANLLSSISVSLLFVVLFCYSIRQQVRGNNSALRQGLIFAVGLTSVLYLASPYSMSGGTIANPRFILFAMLLSILFFGAHQFSEQAKLTIKTAGVAIALLQIGVNLPVYAKINEDAAEYLSATEVIAPKSTLLSLCFANDGCGVGSRGPQYLRISPFAHLAGYVSAQQHLVNLSLVDPHTDYFPMRYRPELDAFPYVKQSEAKGKPVWGAKIGDYSRQTGGRIDYVVLWNISDAWRNGEDVTPIVKWLSDNYELIFTSVTTRLNVYRRKGFYYKNDGHDRTKL